jgi:hypothetical protein
MTAFAECSGTIAADGSKFIVTITTETGTKFDFTMTEAAATALRDAILVVLPTE